MKYFVCSDVHSFFTPMMNALHNAGFDENNPEHIIIHCGDLLDRGTESKECINFFLNRPQDILIKGNHEDLLVEYLQRGYPYGYDYSNGTVNTISDICDGFISSDVYLICAYHYVKPYLDRVINYFETQHYIFVHGWIPCFTEEIVSMWNTNNRTYQYKPDWRESSNSKWRDACWFNGMDCAHNGIIEPNKTIVCGHWHASYGHAKFENKGLEFGDKEDFSPYYAPGIIAIDACTAHTGKVNVIVLEDELCEK